MDILVLAIIVGLVLGVLSALSDGPDSPLEKWAAKQKRQEQKAKGFITPPKPDKPAGPGLYKRIEAWNIRHNKKLWAIVIIMWLIYLFI